MPIRTHPTDAATGNCTGKLSIALYRVKVATG